MAATEEETTRVLREMLQEAAGFPDADWFEFIIGPPTMDLDAAPYGALDIPWNRGWMVGFLPVFIWMPELATS